MKSDIIVQMMDFNILAIGIVIASILVSMTFHEAMHAYVGYWLGDDTAVNEGRLTLNPIAHIDLFATILLPVMLLIIGAPPFGAAKPVPFNPYNIRGGEWGAALIAVAGPLTNLLLAFVAGLVLFFVPSFSIAGEIIMIFLQVNVAFFLFNMIPFPPLDGSRVLYAIAPDGVRNIMRTIEGFGLIGIALFIFLLFPLFRPVFGEVYNSLVNFLVF